MIGVAAAPWETKDGIERSEKVVVFYRILLRFLRTVIQEPRGMVLLTAAYEEDIRVSHDPVCEKSISPNLVLASMLSSWKHEAIRKNRFNDSSKARAARARKKGPHWFPDKTPPEGGEQPTFVGDMQLSESCKHFF